MIPRQQKVNLTFLFGLYCQYATRITAPVVGWTFIWFEECHNDESCKEMVLRLFISIFEWFVNILCVIDYQFGLFQCKNRPIGRTYHCYSIYWKYIIIFLYLCLKHHHLRKINGLFLLFMFTWVIFILMCFPITTAIS